MSEFSAEMPIVVGAPMDDPPLPAAVASLHRTLEVLEAAVTATHRLSGQLLQQRAGSDDMAIGDPVTPRRSGNAASHIRESLRLRSELANQLAEEMEAEEDDGDEDDQRPQMADPPADEDLIAALPRRRVTNKEVGTVLCTVCQDEAVYGESVVPLACGHDYCVSCIESWLRVSGTCPVCRRIVGDEDRKKEDVASAPTTAKEGGPETPVAGPEDASVNVVDPRPFSHRNPGLAATPTAAHANSEAPEAATRDPGNRVAGSSRSAQQSSIGQPTFSVAAGVGYKRPQSALELRQATRGSFASDPFAERRMASSQIGVSVAASSSVPPPSSLSRPGSAAARPGSASASDGVRAPPTRSASLRNSSQRSAANRPASALSGGFRQPLHDLRVTSSSPSQPAASPSPAPSPATSTGGAALHAIRELKDRHSVMSMRQRPSSSGSMRRTASTGALPQASRQLSGLGPSVTAARITGRPPSGQSRPQTGNRQNRPPMPLHGTAVRTPSASSRWQQPPAVPLGTSGGLGGLLVQGSSKPRVAA